jgi:hypothetical protein
VPDGDTDWNCVIAEAFTFAARLGSMPGGSYGLKPDWIRLGVKPPPESRSVRVVLAEVLDEGKPDEDADVASTEGISHCGLSSEHLAKPDEVDSPGHDPEG